MREECEIKTVLISTAVFEEEFWFFLFFSSRWSFGLEKEKKGRTPKSPARNQKYSYVYFVNKYA